MSLYYCTSCGATLNRQKGFRHKNGYWYCTKCGQLLIDELIANGQVFEDVAWFCDNCNSFLNTQDGFTDGLGSWKCSECGYENSITAEDIIDSGDLIEEVDFDELEDSEEVSGSQDEESTFISCPNCGTNLNDQWSFNEYNEDYECTECGAQLHRDYSCDPYEIVESTEDDDDNFDICSKCGSDLNFQWLFKSDDNYECAECGAHLHRNYSFESYEIVEPEKDDEENYDKYLNDSVVNNTYHPDSDFDWDYYTNVFSKKKRFNGKKLIKLYFFFFAIIAIAFIFYEFTIMKPVMFSADELVGINYNETIKSLITAGFSNVSKVDIDDLSINNIEDDGLVTEVKIGPFNNFKSTLKVPTNVPITVTYHSLERFFAPIGSKEAKKSNYRDIEKQFRDEGFVNVTVVPHYDIVTGWFSGTGEVESVTIDGNEHYSTTLAYRADADIVITYHDLRRNNPN